MKCSPYILSSFAIVVILCIFIMIVLLKRPKETFASSEEMSLWKPRIQDAVRCMLHLSFLGNTDARIYLYGDNILATNLFRTLFKEAGFESSANYFARTLWPDYRTFIESFPLSRKPLTLEEINTFVQNAPIFNADTYPATFDACQPDLTNILDIYNSCKSFDVTRRLYGSPELNTSLEKRADYILCALKKSVDYTGFTDALTYARFKNQVYVPNYFIYWNANQWYNRFKEESLIRTYLKNLLHIFYELEWVLSENKEAPDISSLPSTSPSCQEVIVSSEPKQMIRVDSSNQPKETIIIQDLSNQPKLQPQTTDFIYVGSDMNMNMNMRPQLNLAPLKIIQVPKNKSTSSTWKKFDTLDSSDANRRMMIIASICLGFAGILYISAIVSVAVEKTE